MSRDIAAVPVPQVISARETTESTRDRRFFNSMAVAAALAVFAGFAPTYYLKGLYGAPTLSPLMHLHGLVFTSWFVLFLAQTALIAARCTDLHRRLGIAGGLLALAMLVVGTAVAVAAAKRPPTLNVPMPLVFLVIPISDMVVFAVLVTAGLYSRRNRDRHKRLMLLATIAILNAGLGRLVFPGGVLAFLRLPVHPLTIFGLTTLFVGACVCYDRLTRGRVDPAFLWGGAFLVASLPVRLFVGGTAAWLTFARWVTS